jgi:pectate lyase
MTRPNRRWLLFGSTFVFGASLALVPATPAEQVKLAPKKVPAFPGAEGAGAYTPGGRGGKVYLVKNLNDKGPGSLREAVEAKGPRMVLFRVAGIIHLDTPLSITHPYITIAGQSAPGDGVCVRNQTFEINTHDVVIRYLRFRRGNLKVRDDALGGHPVKNVIIDHVSASWGLDENLSLYRHVVKEDGGKLKKLPVENLTIQWTISSEALDRFNHAFGGTWGGKNCSFHHNLFACNTGRNPSIGMGGSFDFRNNVLFNWRHRTIDGGDGSSRVNVIANYFKPGPATTSEALRYRICKVDARSKRDEFPGFGKWYVADNYVHGNPKVTADNWAGGVQYAPEKVSKGETIPMGTEKDVRVLKPFPAAPVTQQKAEEVYELVLAHAGASLPRRDAVDLRVLEAVRTGKPTFKNGIIDSPADVGGWPEYKAGAGPDLDSDGDGIPDWWEKKYGLDPNDPSDGVKDKNGDGYTNLEKYLNGIDPTVYVDYTKPENNKNLFHKPAKPKEPKR